MADRCLLYYITDRTAFAGEESTRHRRVLEKIAEAARAGVDYIQLREKDLPTCDLESLALEAARAMREARKLGPRPENPVLLINSRTDVALAIGADGVHLRSDDISPQEVKGIWRRCGAGADAREKSEAEPVIGVSCHSSAEVVQAAANGATFAVFAPVFEKEKGEPADLAMLGEACQARIPVLALGGIALSNARSCLGAGAAGVAGIRLFQENDVESVVEALRSRERSGD